MIKALPVGIDKQRSLQIAIWYQSLKRDRNVVEAKAHKDSDEYINCVYDLFSETFKNNFQHSLTILAKILH